MNPLQRVIFMVFLNTLDMVCNEGISNKKMSEHLNIIGNTMFVPYLHNFLIIISKKDIY